MHPCGPPESPWKEKEGQRVLWDDLKGEANFEINAKAVFLFLKIFPPNYQISFNFLTDGKKKNSIY